MESTTQTDQTFATPDVSAVMTEEAGVIEDINKKFEEISNNTGLPDTQIMEDNTGVSPADKITRTERRRLEKEAMKAKKQQGSKNQVEYHRKRASAILEKFKDDCELQMINLIQTRNMIRSVMNMFGKSIADLQAKETVTEKEASDLKQAVEFQDTLKDYLEETVRQAKLLQDGYRRLKDCENVMDDVEGFDNMMHLAHISHNFTSDIGKMVQSMLGDDAPTVPENAPTFSAEESTDGLKNIEEESDTGPDLGLDDHGNLNEVEAPSEQVETDTSVASDITTAAASEDIKEVKEVSVE